MRVAQTVQKINLLNGINGLAAVVTSNLSTKSGTMLIYGLL